MKLVIDANVGWKGLVPEQGSEKALELLDGFRKGAHELLAPDLYVIEVGSILVTAARSGRVRPGDVDPLYAELMASLPVIYQSIALFPRAFQIASRTRASIYDCLYVALAEREGCNLVTADDKLLKALPGFPIVGLSTI